MNIQTITMIQKHIDLVAKVMKNLNPNAKGYFNPFTHKEYVLGYTHSWSYMFAEISGKLSDAYPEFNEAEFRKACGEGE